MSVLLAVPTRELIHCATVTRLQEIRDKYQLDPVLYQRGALNVAHTRNKIVQAFLNGRWDTLAMVDDDVLPPLDFLDREGDLQEFGAISSPCLVVLDNPLTIMYWLLDVHGDGYRPHVPEPGLHECAAVGTGAILISREALLSFDQPPFYITSDPKSDNGR